MSFAIEVRDLRFRYTDGTEALAGISFAISAGDCVGIIGPNGAGKSTLLWHLNGLLPEKASEQPAVFVNGQALRAQNLHLVRQQVGLLFQDASDQLFCPTVFDDVAFGPRQLGLDAREVDARVREAIHAVGLSGAESRLPHHLSGGEKRRVCLAGVLACRPQILVLDEPTSDLDPRGRRELRTLLQGITLTRIIATHDLELVAQLCSRVIVLDGGKIVADGPVNVILNDEPMLLKHGLERPHIMAHLGMERHLHDRATAAMDATN